MKLDYNTARKYLLKRDPMLKNVLAAYSPANKNSTLSNYTRLIQIIVGQQLSGAAAKTIFTRLTDLIGDNFSPNDLLNIDEEDFLQIGISRAKVNYTQLISLHLKSNPNYFLELDTLNSSEKILELTKFKGVGIWTASIFTMSSDLTSDVFAYGDGTLNRVIQEIYQIDKNKFDKTLETIVSKWEPYKTLVCNAMWNYNDTVLNQARKRI